MKKRSTSFKTDLKMAGDIRHPLLIRKDRSRLMRTVGFLLWPIMGRNGFVDRWWTTLRLPLWRAPVIYYPRLENSPGSSPVKEHEMIHAKDFEPWYGPWRMGFLFLLPVWGRWVIEREAYLLDIINGRHSPESASEMIWRFYGWPWPRKWMRRWFEGQLETKTPRRGTDK